MNIKTYLLQSQNHEDFIELLASDIKNGTLKEEVLFNALDVLRESIGSGLLATRFQRASTYDKAKSYIEEALKVKDIRLYEVDSEVDKVQIDLWKQTMNKIVKSMLNNPHNPIEFEVDVDVLDNPMASIFDIFSIHTENVGETLNLYKELMISLYQKVFPFNSSQSHKKAYVDTAIYFRDELTIEFEAYLSKTNFTEDSDRRTIYKFFKTDSKSHEYVIRYVFTKLFY